MNRQKIFLILLSFIAASYSFAGLNPLDPGLPQGWTAKASRGYEPVNIGLPQSKLTSTNSWGSAMCIECHGANPSALTSSPSTPLPSGDTEAMYRGSHFVKNYTASAWSAPTVQNNTFTSEKTTAWTGSGGFSRYGTPGTNDTNAIPDGGPSPLGEMVCESCHSLTMNVGGNLLLDAYNRTTGVATLCEGCHPNVASGPPYHHPLASGAGVPTSNDVGADSDVAAPHDIAINHTTHVLSTPRAASGQIAYYGATITCISCHKPHDAMTSAAARVLRRGISQFSDVPAALNKPINVVYYLEVPGGYNPGDVVQKSSTGISRKAEFVSPEKMITNVDPLCDACHI